MTQKPLSLWLECTSDQRRTNDEVMHEVRSEAEKSAAASDRKWRDAELLEGLDALLKSLRADEPGEPKPLQVTWTSRTPSR